MRDIPIDNAPNPRASYLLAEAPAPADDGYRRVAAGPMLELLGSGFYFAPFAALSACDAGALIDALKAP